MKAQMKFQKILSLVTLILAAVVFIFAISFFTGNISDIYNYSSKNNGGLYKGADVFIDAGQAFVSALEIMVIVYLIVIAITYIMGNNSRRNYYITNYVATGLVVAMAAVVALYGLIMMFVLMNAFYNQVDWAKMQELRDIYSWNPKFQTEVGKEPTMFIIGIVVFLLVLVNCLAWVYNLIWKIKLMKGEKELLEKGLVKGVA